MSGAATTSSAAVTPSVAPQEAASSLRSGSRLLLIAVGAVVVFVTLPLLQGLALKENERDALRVLELVGSQVFAAEAPSLGFDDLLQPRSELARRLPDTRLLAGGRLMFHHGYLFEILERPEGGRELRAWPLRHGETGLGAFWSSAPGSVLGHPNSAAVWSGVGSAPELSGQAVPAAAAGQDAESAGWRSLEVGPSARAGM